MKNLLELNEDCEKNESMSESEGDGKVENYLDFFNGYKENDGERIDTIENTELSFEFYEKIPVWRRSAVEKAFENSDSQYIEFVDKYKGNLEVGYAQEDEGSFYRDNKIFMNENYDDDEYAEVFSHELGHYLDEQQGWYSQRAEYIDAVNADALSSMEEQRRQEMLDELFAGDVCYNRHVSDILSSMGMNNSAVVERYWDEGVPYYQHSTEYLCYKNRRQNEIYANMMVCRAENNEETLEFLKKYFPHTYNETMNSMEDAK